MAVSAENAPYSIPMIRRALVIAGLVGAGNAHADLLSHDRLEAHVAALDITGTTYDQLDTSRITFSLTALVPGYGTYRLEKRVFGEVRPAGIVGDWVLGGLVPAGLAIGALVVDDPDTRDARVDRGRDVRDDALDHPCRRQSAHQHVPPRPKAALRGDTEHRWHCDRLVNARDVTMKEHAWVISARIPATMTACFASLS